MSESDIYTLWIDFDTLFNVSPKIKNAQIKLDYAYNIIKSVKVPDDFEKADVIKKASKRIKELNSNLESAKNGVEKLYYTYVSVQIKNNNLTETIRRRWEYLLASGFFSKEEIDTIRKGRYEKITDEKMKKEMKQVLKDKEKSKYIKEIKIKADLYNSKTDYKCIVDVDKCQVTILHLEDGNWKCIALWNTLQGIKEQGSAIGAEWKVFYDEEKFKGRSRTFTGNYEIRNKTKNGNKSCFVSSNMFHSDNIDDDLCQGFEPSSWGDPDVMELEDRYQTHGCTNISDQKAEWIYDNIPIGTKVVVFDKIEPYPELSEKEIEKAENKKKRITNKVKNINKTNTVTLKKNKSTNKNTQNVSISNKKKLTTEIRNDIK